MIRKGIILAGGTGSRLRPLTTAVSKQLLPVYDKPLVYFPLTTMMLAGVREILMIVNPQSLDSFRGLVGDGSQWGISISFEVQDMPTGLAHGPIIAEEFLQGQSSMMILGDTIFHGANLDKQLTNFPRATGATATRIIVDDPREFGVLELAEDLSIISIEEKPIHPKSNSAIPGLYFFDESAPRRARSLAPSKRGELEVTDLLRSYLADGMLESVPLPRGTTWLDIGSIDGLLAAAELVRTLQGSTGQLVGSPDETAWRMGYISKSSLLSLAAEIKTNYGRMLERAADQNTVEKDIGN
jgi:glucose-1-phosphate thymidylyltransferase